jgi:hypothetical protein
LFRSLVPIAVSLFIAINAFAAGEPVCPAGMPASTFSTPSYSTDDIPATNIDINTEVGTTVKARANHNIAFIQVTTNDQRVWFGVDANPGLYRVFYNRRTRATITSPWYWEYTYSPAVITYAPGASNVPGAVLYSTTPRYYDSVSNHSYKYVLYESFQPTECDFQVAGFLYYAFSDDGICWTPHRPATRTGGPSFPCSSLTNSVPIEQVTAIDAGDRIWLVGAEGDIQNQLIYAQNMNRTMTSLGWVSVSDPGSINLHTTPELTNSGVYLPSTGPSSVHPDRYKPYAYFFNLQMAWDSTTGYLYIGRAYPYPFDRGFWDLSDAPYDANTPTYYEVANGCAGPPGTFPNRVQIYKMYLGSLANMGLITTGTWTLVNDTGGPLGYAFNTWPGGPGTQTPLVTNQTSVGRDHGAVSFLRNGAGNLVRSGTTAYWFGADTFKLAKGGNVPCRVTGNERVITRTLP